MKTNREELTGTTPEALITLPPSWLTNGVDRTDTKSQITPNASISIFSPNLGRFPANQAAVGELPIDRGGWGTERQAGAGEIRDRGQLENVRGAVDVKRLF